MRILRYLITIILITTSSTALPADAEQWRLEKDKNGIQVYSRAVEGWSIREIRGVSVIHARLSSVVAVITDVAAMHEFTDVVARAEIRNRESDTRYQVYSMISMPWPVSDRDILDQREIHQNPDTLTVTITNIATHDVLPPEKGLVRLVNSHQQWTLTPQSEGTVMAETRTLSDPAGPIPAAVINVMSVSMPFHSLTKLQEMAQREAYMHAQLPFIREPADGK